MRNLLHLGYVQTILLINVGVFACISEGRIWLSTFKIKHWRIFKEENQPWNVLKTFPKTSKKRKKSLPIIDKPHQTLYIPFNFYCFCSLTNQASAGNSAYLSAAEVPWLFNSSQSCVERGWGGSFPLFHLPKATCALAAASNLLDSAGSWTRE